MAKTSKLQARRQAARVSKQSECRWGIVVLIAAHVAMASTGILRCSGILYLPWMNEFDLSAKETAAIQSFMSSPTCFAVLIGGVLCNHFGCRFTGILGGFLMWLGLFCSYWVNDIVQLYATAALMGIGTGIAVNASSVIITFYFTKRFNVANAVACAGYGTGIMAIPPLFQLLLDRYGWRGACLVTSAIMANVILCGVLFRPRQFGLELNKTASATNSQEDLRQQLSGENDDDTDDDDYTDGRTGEVTDEPNNSTAIPVRYINISTGNKTEYKRSRQVVKLLKRLSDEIGLNIMRKSFRFSLTCVIQLLYCCGYVAFPLFLIPRAQTIDVAPSTAASLLSMLGIGSVIGYLGNPPMIGWRISAEHVTAICAGLTGIACLLVTADGYAYLAVASFIYGFASGAFYAIFFVLCRSFVGVQHYALGVGLMNVFIGTGFFIGSILAVIIAGVLSNHFGCRFTGILGGFFMWLGLFCSYWANNIVQLYATAVIIGIGMGFLINASSVIINFYFTKRFNVANAVLNAGRGTGMMAIPPLFQLLLDGYGWRGACLVTSAIMANMIPCGVLFRHRQFGLELNKAESKTSSQEELRQQPSDDKDNDTDDDDYTDGGTVEVTDEPDTSTATPVRYVGISTGDTTGYNRRVVKLLKRLSDEVGLTIMRKSFRFSLDCVIQLLYCCGYVAFPMFLIPRAQTIGVAPSSAASLMSILGIGDLIGSLGNALMIGWRISAEHVIAICASLAGIACLLVTADGYAYLAVASFIYGFVSGAFLAISIVLCHSFVGVQHFTVAVGVIYVFSGTGYFIGSILAGWIFDATRSYVAVFYMLTGFHFTCALKCLLFPLLKRIEPGLDPKVSNE